MKDDFENQLKKQPFREIPHEWRESILSAAELTQPETEPSFQSQFGFVRLLRQLLWPNPQAWAALACIWLITFGINLANSEAAPRLPEAKASHLSPETYMALQQQRLLRLELFDTQAGDEHPLPRPRTQRDNGTGSAWHRELNLHPSSVRFC